MTRNTEQITIPNFTHVFYTSEVLRLGFTNCDKKWLIIYQRSLPEIWECEATILVNMQAKSVYTTGLGLEYTFQSEPNLKFSVEFKQSTEKEDIIWQHHYVPEEFFFKPYICDEWKKKLPALISKVDEKVLRSVIRSLITHPNPHQHIVFPIDNHEIRIGGGIGNMYLFLFHLRVQFCPSEKKKNEEEDRLVELFSKYIKKRDKQTIPANILMSGP